MNEAAGASANARDPVLSLRSEFGWAQVSMDTSANGPRLRVCSPRTGRTVWLDPLEVESLTQWRHEELVAIVLSHAYDDRTYDENAGESPSAIEDGR